MEIFIRNAELNDSQAIAELSSLLGYEARSGDVQERLKVILENADHCVFVAVQEGKILAWIHGFQALRVESEAFVEIGGLVVAEDFRGKGIGKRLVDMVAEWGQLKDCKKVRVRCNTFRKASHNFYKRLGFAIDKEQMVFDRVLNPRY